MSVEYEVFTEQVAKAGKMRSGDAVVTADLPHENQLFLALADGVGSRPCDWLASKTACSVAENVFKSCTGSIKDRIQRSILRAHQNIRAAFGECSGMQTTLVVVVWEKDANTIHYASIGDSRIYLFSPFNFRQLKKDDTATYILKPDIKTGRLDGRPRTATVISKVLGQEESLEFSVFEESFIEGQSLVLVTDGMHGGGSFIREMLVLLDQRMVGPQLPGFVGNQSADNSDDAAIIIVRRKDPPATTDGNLEKCLAEQTDIRNFGIPAYVIAPVINKKLFQAASDGSIDMIVRWLNYAEQFRIQLDPDGLIQLLEPLSHSGNPGRILSIRVQQLIHQNR